jgi:adenine-specific DNA-methyltransferase
MNEIFGEENFRNEIVVGRTKTAPYIGTSPEKAGVSFKSLMVVYDNIYLYSKSDKFFNKFSEGIITEKRKSYWKDFKTFFDRNYNRYELLGIVPEEGCSWMWRKEYAEKALKNYHEYLKFAEKTNISLEDYWEKTGKILDFLKKEGNSIKYWIPPEKCVSHNNWSDLEGYGRNWKFQTENSEILLKRVIESTSTENDLVMDFFLGSGTTTAVAHKLKRKWIGIEMGEHFWTVILPRMKKVLSYDKSGISKEKDVKEKYNEKTAGGFFKYQILEQYEDTLDNIEIKENQEMLNLFKDEYLLKYFLDYETRESPYLLNIEYLKNPFAYKLKVNLSEVGEPQEKVVDIPETFNYLLGLKTKKVKFRNYNGKKYMFILGEKENKTYAIVWRYYDDAWIEEDFKQDKEFVKKELSDWSPQVVYINGQSILTADFGKFIVDVNYIEPEFKKLMNSEVK